MTALRCALALLAPQDPAAAQAPPPIVVEGRADDLVGVARSASEGAIGQEEIARRPLLRSGELLEFVPGVTITQHSGTGKANQQFARGFNLDHGTDLATSLYGMPLNMPSHGHGQGYTDLGLLIPELVESVRWRLGPYDARDGDFASVGAIDIDVVRSLDRGIFSLGAGSYGYRRTLLADSHRVGDGDLLLALELQALDGRFTVDEDYDKKNGLLSWSTERFRVLAFGYDATWTATDQIPKRAVRSGALGRFDSLDPTSGGRTGWYGLTAEWTPDLGVPETRLVGYAFGYDLDLFSNFTYALDDPIGGDQFEQRDRRYTFGSDARQRYAVDMGAVPGELAVGVQLRDDEIHNGLYRSRSRSRTGTVRADEIRESHVAGYTDLALEPLPRLRGHVGVRADQYWFDVDSDRAVNSGADSAGIVGGKAGLVFGPFGATEFYVDAGTGFHSNDARGVLLRDDPTTPTPDDGVPVDALVRSRGAEVGVRSAALPGLRTTLSAWGLESDGELVFVGDAGTTEPNRGSRRYGLDWAVDWRPLSWLAVDADLALARARFRGDDPAGDRIPGALPLTFRASVSADVTERLLATVRLRHLGRRPLSEDGAVESTSTTLVNARVAWRLDERREFALDVLNALDRRASDIEYYYASRLPGEATPVDDVHFHPVEPFTLRLSFTARF